MSSTQRAHFSGRSLPGTAQMVTTYFTNTDGYNQPFPWRFNKLTQQLDLEYVDGFTANKSLSDNPMFFRGQQLGGLHLVQGLGPKFIEWCETSLSADEGTVELVEAPIVINANMVAPRQDPNSAESQEQTYPISFEKAAGTAEGQYSKTVVFMKPMVIKYQKSGTDYWRWFNQNFEGNT
jgi:hypothetical protein